MPKTRIRMTEEDYIKSDKKKLRRVRELLEEVLEDGFLIDEYEQLEEALHDVEDVLERNDGRKKY